MKSKLFNFLPLILITCFMFFCAQLVSQAIVGKWDYSNSAEVLEFTEDGIFRLSIAQEGYTYGTYKYNDEALILKFLDSEENYVMPVRGLTCKNLVIFDVSSNTLIEYYYKGAHEIPTRKIEQIKDVNYLNWILEYAEYDASDKRNKD